VPPPSIFGLISYFVLLLGFVFFDSLDDLICRAAPSRLGITSGAFAMIVPALKHGIIQVPMRQVAQLLRKLDSSPRKTCATQH
jgi:hypothetical protein